MRKRIWLSLSSSQTMGTTLNLKSVIVLLQNDFIKRFKSQNANRNVSGISFCQSWKAASVEMTVWPGIRHTSRMANLKETLPNHNDDVELPDESQGNDIVRVNCN